MMDREALRVRLLDILGLFAPREGWEADHRVDGWLDRLMEAERPDPEVERLREALGLMDHAERDAEDELHEVEAALQARLQRDAHVVAVEAERDALRAKVEAIEPAILGLVSYSMELRPDGSEDPGTAAYVEGVHASLDAAREALGASPGVER